MALRQYKQGFRKLHVWQQAHQFTILLYKKTALFPQEDRFSLTDQIRRSASSISACIAEGSYMRTSAHQHSYYVRSYGSLTELDNHLQLAFDLGRFTQEEYKKYLEYINCIGAQLHGLLKSTAKKRTNKLTNQ